MKTLILILISFIIAIFINACGIVTQTSAYKTISMKEAKEFDEEYGGVYVFNKEFYDEILFIEQQRDKYRASKEFENDEKIYDEALKNKKREIENLMIKKYGEEAVKNDDKVQDEKWEMLEAFKKQNPFPTDKKFPRVLSNGCKYKIDNGSRITSLLFQKYIDCIKQYMGEELANRFESEQKNKRSYPFIELESYYDCNEGWYGLAPISFRTMVYLYEEREWGLAGDEGAGFRLYNPSWEISTGKNIFYFINDSFVKSDEKIKYKLSK